MIKLFRLISGEEILGEIKDSSGDTHRIKNPCVIMIGAGPDGKPSLNMQPWLLFSTEKEVTLKDAHVLFVTGVDIKIENKYNEIFGSGIVIAQQPILR
jgi:hypothetical protein